MSRLTAEDKYTDGESVTKDHHKKLWIVKVLIGMMPIQLSGNNGADSEWMQELMEDSLKEEEGDKAATEVTATGLMLRLPREDSKEFAVAKGCEIREVEERTQGNEMLVENLCFCGYDFLRINR